MKTFQVLTCVLSLCVAVDVYARGASDGYIEDSAFLTSFNTRSFGDGDSVNRIAIHLGYQEADYYSTLKQKLLNEIGTGGKRTINIAKLTTFGLGPEIVDLLTNPDSSLSGQRQFAKFFFVIEEADINNIGIQELLEKLASTELKGEKTFSVVVLKTLNWTTFATDLALRAASLDELSLDIFLSEGGQDERNIVFDLITHSRYRSDLKRFGLHLGLNHLPKNINSVDGYLAATEVASQMNEILLLNRYADIEMSFHEEPDVRTIATIDPSDRINKVESLSHDSERVSKQVSDYKLGKNHANNLVKTRLIKAEGGAHTDVYVSGNDGVLTLVLDMTEELYKDRYLKGLFLVHLDVGLHQIPLNLINWQDLESLKFDGRKLVIAEVDLAGDDRYAGLVDVDRLDILLSPQIMNQVASGHIVSTSSLEPARLSVFHSSDRQIENSSSTSLDLKNSEYQALVRAIEKSKTKKQSVVVDLSIKPRNNRIGTKFEIPYYESSAKGLAELVAYKKYLKQNLDEKKERLRQEKAMSWIKAQSGCSSVFGGES